VISGVLMTVDDPARPRVLRELDRRPRVAGADSRLAAIGAFYKTIAEMTGMYTWIAVLMGALVNFGVVHNSARIALAERGRELASLRVLGFTQGEVAYILLGELALLVLISLPLSIAAGYGLSWLVAHSMQSDLYRVPVVLTPSGYAFAALAAERLARTELDRARTLHASGMVSAGMLDQARTRADTAGADLAGRVLRRPTESETPVSAGQVLLEIGDPEALEIETEVLSTDAVRLSPGMVARVLRWGGEGELAAKVMRVEPGGFTKVSALGVEEQRTRVILDFDSPRECWAALGDAYRVEVEFIVRREADVHRPEAARSGRAIESAQAASGGYRYSHSIVAGGLLLTS